MARVPRAKQAREAGGLGRLCQSGSGPLARAFRKAPAPGGREPPSLGVLGILGTLRRYVGRRKGRLEALCSRGCLWAAGLSRGRGGIAGLQAGLGFRCVPGGQLRGGACARGTWVSTAPPGVRARCWGGRGAVAGERNCPLSFSLLFQLVLSLVCLSIFTRGFC